MASRLNFLVLMACISVPFSHGASEIPEVMKVVSLDGITAQGVLHLPPSHTKMEENHLCHYWISFLNDIPEEIREHHKDFGISVVALDIELKPEDSIKLIAHPLDVNSSNPGFEKVVWDSSSNSDSPRLEFKPKYQDVCINLEGGWEWSRATLVVTLYFDNTNMYSDYCPTGMTRCKCSSDSRRCVSEDLICNGIENCGIHCEYDEGEKASCKTSQYFHTKETCSWANFEYLLMMVMTGLLLILIPAVFLLTFMYHKRANMTRSAPGAFDGNNNVNRNNGQYPHVITMSPTNDIPPRYEELSSGAQVSEPTRLSQQTGEA